MKKPLLICNLQEAKTISRRSIISYEDITLAAEALLSKARSVFITGGDFKDDTFSQDYWTDGTTSFWLAHPRWPKKNYIGKHNALAHAIERGLKLGFMLKDALILAKMYVTRGLRLAHPLDSNQAIFYHGGFPEEQVDLPYLSLTPLLRHPTPFKRCPIGFYPVVDSSRWVEQLLQAGVKCIQLRIKNAPKKIGIEEIKRSVQLAKKYGALLFVNDDWELAIELGAEGVHLGQEDLSTAPIEKIHAKGLYLGVSTHCYYEVARAHALQPSYIACGPIYPTTSKIMSFPPQGILQLERYQRTLDYPIVAIGGIDLERLSEVLRTGVGGIAVISAVTKAAHPIQVTRQFLQQIPMIRHSPVLKPSVV